MTQTAREQIAELKARRNAVILAHNYQIDSVQSIADFTGDSLGLSRQATQVEADVIVFCGVKFMAETAAILNPGKTVLLPELQATCPMAAMITPEQVRALKARHPGAAVVCYVNSTAEVKALSDVCCTSANAVEVVNSIEPGRPVIFVPDRNLGHYVAQQTGRDIILTSGFCPTHERIRPEHVAETRRRHPGAEVMVHPECLPAVVDMADVVASTSGMLRHARKCGARTLIVGTEIGLLYGLRRESPDKEFIPLTSAATCPNMKLTTLGSVLLALEEMRHRITVPDEVAEAARGAVDRMLQIGAPSPTRANA
jgi:quinolinate synthase